MAPDFADGDAAGGVKSRGRADRRAHLGIVLAAAQQVAERKDHAENHHQQDKESDQVPALENEIAAVFFGCHLFFLCRSP